LSCGVHRKRHCPSPENATALSLSSSVSLSPTLSLTGWLGRTALSPSPLFFLLLLLSHGWSGQQGNSPSSFLLLSFFSFPSSSLSPSRLTLSLSLVSHARQGARHSLLPSFTRGQQGLRACCVAALVLSLSRLDPRVNSLSSKIAPHFTPKQLSLSPTLALLLLVSPLQNFLLSPTLGLSFSRMACTRTGGAQLSFFLFLQTVSLSLSHVCCLRVSHLLLCFSSSLFPSCRFISLSHAFDPTAPTFLSLSHSHAAAYSKYSRLLFSRELLPLILTLKYYIDIYRYICKHLDRDIRPKGVRAHALIF
jgi:hypothetical protein